MSKAINHSLAICLTTVCFCLLLFTPITKTAWPQDETKIQTLINKLKDPEGGVRRDAAEALGKIGPDAKPAVPALSEAFKDKNEVVRLAAGVALARIVPEGVPALIEALKDKNEVFRLAAAVALARIGPEAVPALIEALKDEDKVVRVFAAIALAEIGPEAKAAVPDLIEALKDKDKDVRRVAAQALVKIGLEARLAVPVLIEAFKDENRDVRRFAAQDLGSIGSEAKSAVPALSEALKDEDIHVCKQAAQALGQIGPEAKAAVPALIEALKDKGNDVRLEAAEALGKIGPEAKAAVPALIEAFKDENRDVRRFAARALERIGSEAKSAVPALSEALKDKDESLSVRMVAAWALMGIGPEAMPALIEALKVENRDVRRAAALGLGEIATALRDDKATDMIKDLIAAKKALSAYPELEDKKKEVRRAIEYLEQIKPPLWKIVWSLVKENILISSLILAYLLWVIIWLISFWLRPLALLQINRALKPFDFQLPKQFGAIKLPIRFLLFIGFLNYHPRVLDAWAKTYISTCGEKFSKKDTVYDRHIHISVPVEFDRQTIPGLTPKQLRSTFARQIGCLLIWGEGGSGKTSLACQIAKWAMSEDKEDHLCDHLMLPVLIEQELSSEGDQSAFINAVGRQLQDVTDQANPIPVELLERLLRHRRVLVIVDHLSEMSEGTRKLIDPGQKGFPVNAFVVTSRLEEKLGNIAKTEIKPLRVSGDQLSAFFHAYLSERGTRDKFKDPEFFDACRRLSEMVGDRDITLLLAKLYAEQLIAAKEGVADDKLPDNIPDLMLRYLNDLNISIKENRIDDLIIHKDAKVLAWESLKDTYRSAPVRIDYALVVLSEEEAQEHLKYLEDRLRLIKTDPVSKDRFKFLLDPIAEYLAALHLLNLYGDNEESWNNFLAEADGKEGAPETIKGFLLAVRDCIIEKGEEAKVPDFVAGELAKRAGLDIEAINQAQTKQRIQRHINQLSVPEAEDRQQAAQTLSKIGPDAKAAVPALTEVLKDKDKDVRDAAAEALGKIGPEAKAAVPALIEALKDQYEHVRELAAQALAQIGPEAKEAVSALIEALKDQDKSVRINAAQALAQIGPEAKEAVSALIEALKDQNEDIGIPACAAEALGKIGPEAKAAVPALTEALKYKSARRAAPSYADVLRYRSVMVRAFAAEALGKIGPEAKAAVPDLIEALKDKDKDVRRAAASALGKIGPEGAEQMD